MWHPLKKIELNQIFTDTIRAITTECEMYPLK